MQIGVFAEIGRGELVQFAISIELEVGLLCRREEPVGREEPWVPQGPGTRRGSSLAANNYAWGLLKLRRFEEAKALMRKTMRVARRILGESNDLMFMMRWAYAESLYKDADATLDDLREAVTTLEDTALIARRVLGGAHPLAASIERDLQNARAAFDASEKA